MYELLFVLTSEQYMGGNVRLAVPVGDVTFSILAKATVGPTACIKYKPSRPAETYTKIPNIMSTPQPPFLRHQYPLLMSAIHALSNPEPLG